MALIQGTLTAMSHFLKPDEVYLIEIKNGQEFYFIEIREPHQYPLIKYLEIGGNYLFYPLEINFESQQSCAAYVWKLNKHCSCTIRHNHRDLQLMPSNGMIHYSGIIKHAYPQISMYHLDDANLYVPYMESVCPLLCAGQKVNVYNAHIRIMYGRKCIVLCSRSFIQVNEPELQTTSALQNGILGYLLRTYSVGFDDYFSIRNSVFSFQKKFTHSFLHSLGAKNPQTLCYNLLIRTYDYMLKKCSLTIDDKYSEFIRHNECLVEKEVKFNKIFKTIVQSKLWAEEQARNLRLQGNWACLITKNFEHWPLLGFLSVCPVSGRWLLHDSTGVIACIISKWNETLLSLHKILKRGHPFVCLRQYQLIVEKFMVNSGQRTITYLHIYASDVIILSAVNDELVHNEINNDNVTGTHKKFKVVEKSSILRKSYCSQCAVLVNGWNQKEFYILNFDQVFIPHLPFMHHGTIIQLWIPSDHNVSRKNRDNELYYVPHSEIVTVTKCTRIDVEGSSLQGGHLEDCSVSDIQGIYPGKVIHVRGTVIDRFHNSTSRPTFLRDENEENFGLPANEIIPTLSVGKTNDEQSMPAKCLDACAGKFWYSSIKMLFYYMFYKHPDMIPKENVQSIVIKLRDISTHDQIDLYITERNNYVYPLGLVIGSKIRATFVKVIMSKGYNKYLCTKNFSNFEILELEPRGPIKQSPIRLANRSYLISIHVRNIVFTSLCTVCAGKLIKGKCFGCGYISEGSSASVTAECDAVIMGRPTTLYFKKGDLVQQLLQMPEHIWDRFLLMAHKMSGLKYCNQSQPTSFVEKIFHMYVSAIPENHLWDITFQSPSETRSTNGNGEQNLEHLVCVHISRAY